jgi:hypothetical protein
VFSPDAYAYDVMRKTASAAASNATAPTKEVSRKKLSVSGICYFEMSSVCAQHKAFLQKKSKNNDEQVSPS